MNCSVEIPLALAMSSQDTPGLQRRAHVSNYVWLKTRKNPSPERDSLELVGVAGLVKTQLGAWLGHHRAVDVDQGIVLNNAIG